MSSTEVTPLNIVRCPIHGIAYDDELEQCPECAKGTTQANPTSAVYLRVQVRLDRLTPTERAKFEGKTYAIAWDEGTLSGDPAAVELLESEAAIRGLAGPRSLVMSQLHSSLGRRASSSGAA